MIDLKNLTIKKARESLLKGDFSAVELTKAYLQKIKEQNGEINAYLEIFDDAVKQAKVADKKIKNGEGGFLTGIPLAIKDNILIKGKIASSASKILENYRAVYDATAIAKLKKKGRCFWGGQIWTNSPWAVQPKIPPTALPKTRMIYPEFRAVPPAARRRRSQWTAPWALWGRIPEVPSDSRFFLRSRRVETDLRGRFAVRAYGHGVVA